MTLNIHHFRFDLPRSFICQIPVSVTAGVQLLRLKEFSEEFGLTTEEFYFSTVALISLTSSEHNLCKFHGPKII